MINVDSFKKRFTLEDIDDSVVFLLESRNRIETAEIGEVLRIVYRV